MQRYRLIGALALAKFANVGFFERGIGSELILECGTVGYLLRGGKEVRGTKGRNLRLERTDQWITATLCAAVEKPRVA